MEITKKMVDATVTPLKRKDLLGGKVITTKWDPKLEYAWDNGVAIGRYLRGLQDGKLLGCHCRKCNRIMIPPRMFCELCWVPTDEVVELKDTGTINTFCISHVDWKATRLDIEGGVRPYTPAVIEIDGASPGMGILHMIEGIDPWKIKIGMKVKAVWKPAEEREGSITDIICFKPVKSAVVKKAPAKKAPVKKKAKAKVAAKPKAKAKAKPAAKKAKAKGKKK
jgi:uncharacterized OB-fold protein